MIRSRLALVLSLAAALLVGCASRDAAPVEVCAGGVAWSIDGSHPGGAVELGTGALGFQPLAGELPLVVGNQDGTLLVVNARVRGLVPGNPSSVRDAGNPRTRFTAVLDDGTAFASCPRQWPYRTGTGGYAELIHGDNLELLPFSSGQRAFDQDVDLVVEVVDASGNYARDQRRVHLAAPAGYGADAGPPDGGLIDAGATDAAAVDAGAP